MRRYLLDTHTFLWFIWGDERLSPSARQAVEDVKARRFVSMASLWEMAIKVTLGKLSLSLSFEELVHTHILGNDLSLLVASPAHLDHLTQLPFHHRDPFDRLLISQAIREDAVLLSCDTCFGPYDVDILW